MNKYRIAVNTSAKFGSMIAPAYLVENELKYKGYFHHKDIYGNIYTEHVGIYYLENPDVTKQGPKSYDETYGFANITSDFLSGKHDMLNQIEETVNAFITRIVILEDHLSVFGKDTEIPIVDHDGNHFEDGEYYVYHECKRCHKKIFIKLNNDCGYEYPHHWVRHYGPEIEGNLCPSCEEKLSKMKNDLYVRFMEGEKL